LIAQGILMGFPGVFVAVEIGMIVWFPPQPLSAGQGFAKCGGTVG